MKAIFRMAVLCCLLAASYGAFSQFNPAKRIADKVQDRTIKHTDKAIDKGLDAIENDIKGENKDTIEKEGESEEQEAVEQTGDNEENVKTGQQEQTTLQTYSKFDFIPGEKVIFFDDFSQDNVGDFPALWNTNGSGEVTTTNIYPGHWLQFSGTHCIWTNDLLSLPENYTIEFDIIPAVGDEGVMAGYYFRLMQCINVNAWDAGSAPGKAGFVFFVAYSGRPSYHTNINLDGGENLGLSGYIDNEKYYQKLNQKYHISVWVQKSRIRLYQDENKIIDLPRAFNHPGVKMDRIRFEYGAALVSNVRIAVGAPDTRNKLITEGKLVTYGIYFDVNKDVVKPESYGTLKDISTVLTENPDVRVKITGYTDSDGDDASNLDLSKRRAASVKNELVKNFGMAESRIETDGMGETQPVAPNDTPSNKALNRRVEFIKL